LNNNHVISTSDTELLALTSLY